MDFFPLNLILIVAVSWALIFLGYLPTPLLRLELFGRQIFRAALVWIAVAVISPPAILHYYIFIGLLCFVSWWRLRGDHGFSGKLWLEIASALGISLGVVLILDADVPVFPSGSLFGPGLFLIAAIYLGGAVIGLAYGLFVLTRPSVTGAGISPGLVQRYGGLLFLLTLARAALLARMLQIMGLPLPGKLLLAAVFGVLIFLAWLAGRQIRSPRPSVSGPALLGICLIGLVAEMVARSFGL